MNQQQPNEHKSQNVNHAGGNVTQVGRDYTSTTNVNLLISLFFISILALGGLAWMLNLGNIRNPQNSQPDQQQLQPTSTPTQNPSSP